MAQDGGAVPEYQTIGVGFGKRFIKERKTSLMVLFTFYCDTLLLYNITY